MINLADYRALYHKMFNTVTDAERLVTQAASMMRTAQQECEESYLQEEKSPIRLVDPTDDTES